MADDVNKLLGQAYMRMNAALFVSMFGSPEHREKVGQLVDGKLPVEEAERAREFLDRVWGRIVGRDHG